MKYLILLSVLLFSVSCMTVRRIERNCDTFAKVCLTEKDTIIITEKIEVIYRDTIIDYQIKRDTIYQETPVYVKQGLMNSDISHLETDLANSTAQVISGVLKHNLQSGDTIQIKLDNALTEVTILKTRLEKHQDIVTIKENTKFAEFTVKWFWISFFVIVILTLIMVFKNRLLKIFK